MTSIWKMWFLIWVELWSIGVPNVWWKNIPVIVQSGESVWKGVFPEILARLRPGDDRSGEYRSGNECFFGTSLCRMLGFVEFIKHSLRDIPQTQCLIKELAGKGYRLFCLSNMSLEFYDYLKEREVFRYFEGQIISAHEKLIKPEKEIYRILIDRFRHTPKIRSLSTTWRKMSMRLVNWVSIPCILPIRKKDTGKSIKFFALSFSF